MRSETPKVLHSLGGRTLLGHALVAARQVDPERIAVVVRHGRDRVAEHALALDPQVLIADQDDVPGTGRAVQCALSVLDAAVHADQAAVGHPEVAGSPQLAGPPYVVGPVLVLAGDIPMLDGATLGELLAAHLADGNAVTVLTTEPADATGYGRIIREPGTGDVLAVVEERDATDEQRSIREINSSVYVFDAEVLLSLIHISEPTRPY